MLFLLDFCVRYNQALTIIGQSWCNSLLTMPHPHVAISVDFVIKLWHITYPLSSSSSENLTECVRLSSDNVALWSVSRSSSFLASFTRCWKCVQDAWRKDVMLTSIGHDSSQMLFIAASTSWQSSLWPFWRLWKTPEKVSHVFKRLQSHSTLTTIGNHACSDKKGI